MNLQPQMTFIVDTVDFVEIFNSLPPDENINNIIHNLENETVYIEKVPYPLKHGDIFTLYGQDAVYVYNLYIASVPKQQRVLELYDEVSGSGVGSLYFDGSSNIVLAGSGDWATGTSDFTVEWFQYQLSSGECCSRIFAVQPWPDTQIGVSVEEGGNNFYAWIGGEGYGAGIPSVINTWNHMAITRQSGTLRLFKDGIEVNSHVISEDVLDNSNPLYIGSTSDGNYFTGYITNFNFVSGTALYTGDYVVPTSPISPDANTKLLLLASSEDEMLKDSSALNKTVTNNGVTWSSLSPFN